MKTFRYLIVAVLFLLVAGTSGAQTREEKKEALMAPSISQYTNTLFIVFIR